MMEKRRLPDTEFVGEFARRGLSWPFVIATLPGEVECLALSGCQRVLTLTDGRGTIGRVGRW